MADPTTHNKRRRAAAVAAVVAWGAACGGGLAGMIAYQATPGRPAAAPRAWPAASKLPRSAGAYTLVVFVHPRCPCSRATVANLAVLMAHCPAGRVTTTVAFVRPPGVPAGWERTGLWTSAAAIPGVTVVADEGGREAAAFGAATSGQAVLFDVAGRVAFAGGLTPGRGHAGDSGGAAAVRALVCGGPADVTATPVFGCPLSAAAAAGGTTCPR